MLSALLRSSILRPAPARYVSRVHIAGLKGLSSDPPLNKNIIDIFQALAEHEHNTSGNVFKERAFQKFVASVKACPFQITAENLQQIPELGPGITRRLEDVVKTGTCEDYESIKSQMEGEEYATLNLFQRISGIGRVVAKKLYDKGHRTVLDLANDPNLTRHQQIGAKYFYELEQPIPRAEIDEHLKLIEAEVKSVNKKFTVDMCGSYRRGAETSSDMDVLLTHPDVNSPPPGKHVAGKDETLTSLMTSVIERLEARDYLAEAMAKGSGKYMGVCQFPGCDPSTKNPYLHRRIDIRLLSGNHRAAGLLAWTGDAELIRDMRKAAKDKGLLLNEYGLFEKATGAEVPIQTERDVFERLGMAYLEPSERTTAGMVLGNQ